jgi:adenine-specific DNA-methyltransferase
MQVMPSVIYKQSQVAVKYLGKLLAGKIFNNPKDHEVIARIARYVTKPTNNDIILDFFSGSGTIAESVLWQNHTDRGNRRFILVQVPEETPEKSNARKLGYPTIAGIGKERIRRVIHRLNQENAGKLLNERETPEDLGFKVYRLDRSNFKEWTDYQGDDPNRVATLFDAFATPLVEDWREQDYSGPQCQDQKSTKIRT